MIDWLLIRRKFKVSSTQRKHTHTHTKMSLVNVLIFIVISSALAQDNCEGTPPPGPNGWYPFWVRNESDGKHIKHVATPFTTDNGYEIDAGYVGLYELSDPSLQREYDNSGEKYMYGEVDSKYGYPNSTTGGYKVSNESLLDDFSGGLSSENFVVLLQKKSLAENVDVVKRMVDNETKHVLRLRAFADDDGTFRSGCILETAKLYASGSFSMRAKVPAKKGLVFSLWTFHYEEHFKDIENPDGTPDGQYVPDATGDITVVNHEIDWEIPASCPSMCPSDTNYCQGQFDTANLNTYLYSGNSAIANVCARAPKGKYFADDDNFHTYRFEWHAGNSDDPENTNGCTPKVNFFFDDEYVTTVDVFVPSRGSRFVFGMWSGNHNWVGQPDWTEAELLISEIKIEPFHNEIFDSMYPQNVDQACLGKQLWVKEDIPPF